jgi:hypothetical protein
MEPQLKTWFILYIQPIHGKRILRQLSLKHIEYFWPCRTQHVWRMRHSLLIFPLFPSYIFVYSTPCEHAAIKRIDGVLNFVYWLNNLATITDEEINAIRDFITNYPEIKMEKVVMNINETRMNGHDGAEYMPDIKNGIKRIVLPSLGYHLIAEEPYAVKKELVPELQLQTQLVLHFKV